ncbi:MAG TPA: hypothetical protein VNU97_12865 [Rhizomicrobium sp.]|jgi:hypothetical protein|nr:hypothetical protein [Rhizomicrobium sp.]
MNSKQLSSKRKKARKRWRVFFMIAGSIGIGLVVLGFTISLNDESQSVSKFYEVGLALAAFSAVGFGLSSVDMGLWPRPRQGRRRRRRRHSDGDAHSVSNTDAQ